MGKNAMRASASDLGLDDVDVMNLAIELAPELFAALTITKRLAEAQYPIASHAALAKAFTHVKQGARHLDLPGVSISAKDCRDRFPREFLPIEDRFDMLRKTYMAIVIAHTSDARDHLHAAVRGESEIAASHPLDLEALR